MHIADHALCQLCITSAEIKMEIEQMIHEHKACAFQACQTETDNFICVFFS